MSENCNYAPVEKVILIDDRRIEIYWGEQMRRADNENDYLVKYKGEVQELVHWTSDMTWDYGTVYQKESMRTTLSLVHPVDPECAGEVTVQVVGKLTDVKDRPADNEKGLPDRVSAILCSPQKRNLRHCSKSRRKNNTGCSG